MTEPDWERYRAARNAPPPPDPRKQPGRPPLDRHAHRRRRRLDDAAWAADDFVGLGYPLIRLLFHGIAGGTGLGAIWADGVATKVLLGAIAVGIVVIGYIARDATDEPRSAGEWAPPKDAGSKRRR